MEMHEELKKRTGEVEKVVESYLPEEEGHQKTIFEAMNYSVRAGGKRLRPMLMEETYRLFGGTEKAVEPFMAAMEMIHTSSLIHDDLPCMDNDELRRGLPTTWKKFGYDMAVLAGDALMIYAFETASKAFAMTAHPDRAARAIGVLAEKTGIYGMIGGQVVDVELTGLPDGGHYEAASIAVAFDPAQLTFLGTDDGDIPLVMGSLPAWESDPARANETGSARALCLPEEGAALATSTGSVLVRLHFRLADGVTESALTVTDAVLAAADETESLASAAATLTVAGGTVRRG